MPFMIPHPIKPDATYELLEKENIDFVLSAGPGPHYRKYEIILPAKKASGISGIFERKVPIKTFDDIISKICGKGLKLNSYYKKDNIATFIEKGSEFVVIKLKEYRIY